MITAAGRPGRHLATVCRHGRGVHRDHELGRHASPAPTMSIGARTGTAGRARLGPRAKRRGCRVRKGVTKTGDLVPGQHGRDGFQFSNCAWSGQPASALSSALFIFKQTGG